MFIKSQARSKYFKYINSFNLYNNPMKKVYYS